MKTIALIQAHYLDWGGAPDTSVSMFQGNRVIEHVILKLKKWKMIESIVIMAPNDPGNLIFRDIAQKHNVSCFFGSHENILERSIGAIDSVGGDFVVQVMGQHCFIDTDLLNNMLIKFMANAWDFLSLPDSFTPYFAGKIFTRRLLDQVQREVGLLPEPRDIHYARFVAFIENNRDLFKTGIYTDLPKYSTEFLHSIRNSAKDIFLVDRLCVIKGKSSLVSNQLMENYEFAGKFLKSSDVVLDIASGDGFGCDYISPLVLRVVGADINAELIEENKGRISASNISYVVEDACRLTFNDQMFDAVLSMETIEHIPVNLTIDYLKEIYRVLKPGGVFICSTPQNSEGAIPVIPWHEKEYSLKEMKEMLRPVYSLVKIYGAKSGGQLTDDEYGQKMLAVCRK